MIEKEREKERKGVWRCKEKTRYKRLRLIKTYRIARYFLERQKARCIERKKQWDTEGR